MRIGLALAAALMASVTSALAAPPGVINQYNAVCDPNFPTHCEAPSGSGQMPVSGSVTVTGGPATATGAAGPVAVTVVPGGTPAAPNPVFVPQGFITLSRWNQTCACFPNPP